MDEEKITYTHLFWTVVVSVIASVIITSMIMSGSDNDVSSTDLIREIVVQEIDYSNTIESIRDEISSLESDVTDIDDKASQAITAIEDFYYYMDN
jgi:peptidoglycan hydrolase CwlO-like protein